MTGLRRYSGFCFSTLMTTTILAMPAHAQQAAKDTTTVQEIIVTATKRSESLQKVPLSIQALGGEKLTQNNVTNFSDYVKMLPSVSFQPSSPGNTNVYMRGVANGGDGNHSGPLPSVGVYLDEQPVTTIVGALDIHIYDIARVESLSGPQGTLYGASSQSGTLKIITNKPSFKGFEAGYDVQVNQVAHGGTGYVVEGYVNQPVSDKIAVRLVGWHEHDAGFIDNVASSRTYPVSGITINNQNRAKKDYNDIDTTGGRAQARIELNESWTLIPSVIGQKSDANGLNAYDSTKGFLKVGHYFPEYGRDKWIQAALTVEGRISDFDVTYTGGHFERFQNTSNDYTDYSFFYDKLFGSGVNIVDSKGNMINPSQYIIGKDYFSKDSHELRVSSPKDRPLRFIGGVFYQRQTHHIFQDYRIDGLGTQISIKGRPGTLWLTDQMRIDRDSAIFGEVTYDVTPKFTVSAGGRLFKADNSLVGFYGLSSGYSSGTGEVNCKLPMVPYHSAPCTNLDKRTTEEDSTWKLSATYRLTDQKMIYATAATGFRPGGINRNGNLGPYSADYLTSYEVGWKTSWMNSRLRWNGAVFYQDWDKFQFAFLGPNSLTIIKNAPQGKIPGLETDVVYMASPKTTVTGSLTYVEPELGQNYCTLAADGSVRTNCSGTDLLAPKGQALPITPKLKVFGSIRHNFTLWAHDSHAQVSIAHQSKAWADLRTVERAILGQMPAYTTVDISGGMNFNTFTVELFVKNLLDEKGQLTRTAQCTPRTCGAETYIVPIQPRLIGIKFGQKF